MGSLAELRTGHMYKELLREGQATQKDRSPHPVTSDLSRKQSHALPKCQVSGPEPRACLQQPVKKQPSQPPPFLQPLPARKTVHRGKAVLSW